METDARITPTFLFAIYNVLSFHVQFCHTNILPLVLRRLRAWRVLSPENKTSDALEDLALDLAALVNNRSCPTEPKTIPPLLKIRWIGPNSGSAMLLDSDINECQVDAQRRDRGSFYPVSPKCLSPPFHEMASYRSGCCACRQPRSLPDKCSAEHPQTPMLSPIPRLVQAANVSRPDGLVMLASRKPPRNAVKHEGDENTPAVPLLTGNILLSRDNSENRTLSLSAHNGIRPAIARTVHTVVQHHHHAPLSHSSFRHNSKPKSSPSLPRQSAFLEAPTTSRSSSSIEVLVISQRRTPSAGTTLKPRAGTKPSPGPVPRDVSKLKTKGKARARA
jgi:hypothetical protein